MELPYRMIAATWRYRRLQMDLPPARDLRGHSPFVPDQPLSETILRRQTEDNNPSHHDTATLGSCGLKPILRNGVIGAASQNLLAMRHSPDADIQSLVCFV